MSNGLVSLNIGKAAVVGCPAHCSDLSAYQLRLVGCGWNNELMWILSIGRGNPEFANNMESGIRSQAKECRSRSMEECDLRAIGRYDAPFPVVDDHLGYSAKNGVLPNGSLLPRSVA